MSVNYVECLEVDVPARVRFDVPRENQGQTIEIAYGGFDRGEHGPGDPYQRVTDRSLVSSVRYYRLVQS